MNEISRRISFHSSIPPDTYESRIDLARKVLERYTVSNTTVPPEVVRDYQAMFTTARAQVRAHLISLGISEAQIDTHFSSLQLIIGGVTTHYNPVLHTLVLRPDEIQNILEIDTPHNRARVVRHEVAHALSLTMLYRTHDGGITRSGLSIGGFTRAGVVEYGTAINEIVTDAIAVRSGLEVNDSPRARLFHEIAACIATYLEPPITESELYRLFVHVACKGWGARPEGKKLKHIVRAVYGADGMSVLMRFTFPHSETETELETKLRDDPYFIFLSNPPKETAARHAAARALLTKYNG